MQLYNSLSHKKEEFVPNVEGKVNMYTCGPTVYHFAHIGNLRSYIMEDVLEKYLRYVGYDVKRVMNITDVGHLTSDGDSKVLHRRFLRGLHEAEHQASRRCRACNALYRRFHQGNFFSYRKGLRLRSRRKYLF